METITNTIAINRTALRAIALCAAKDDIRYYLNSVMLEVGPTEYRLIATDSHRLAVYRQEQSNEFTGQFILPIDVVSRVKGATKRNQLDVVTVTLTYQNQVSGTFTIADNGTTHHGELIDAKYPDYRNVYPKKLNGEIAQFNPTYLRDFQKMAEIVRGSDVGAVSIGYNGKSAALIDIGDADYQCILMPWRTADVELADWVKQPIDTQEQSEQLQAAA